MLYDFHEKSMSKGKVQHDNFCRDELMSSYQFLSKPTDPYEQENGSITSFNQISFQKIDFRSLLQFLHT